MRVRRLNSSVRLTDPEGRGPSRLGDSWLDRGMDVEAEGLVVGDEVEGQRVVQLGGLVDGLGIGLAAGGGVFEVARELDGVVVDHRGDEFEFDLVGEIAGVVLAGAGEGDGALLEGLGGGLREEVVAVVETEVELDGRRVGVAGLVIAGLVFAGLGVTGGESEGECEEDEQTCGMEGSHRGSGPRQKSGVGPVAER